MSLYDDQKYTDDNDSDKVPDPKAEEKSWYDLQRDKYSDEAIEIADSKWRQIRCKTTTLTYSVTWVNCIFLMVAVVCIPIGAITFNLSQSVIMQEFPAYNLIPACELSDFDITQDWGKECTVNYTLEHDFDPPIYFHYKLTNFYQNHRSYVKSRSQDQLEGNDVTDIDECEPSEVQYSKSSDHRGLKMLPCGLIANSFFNDKYRVSYIDTDTGNIDELCDTPETCTGDETFEPWSEATWYSSPNWEIDNIAWKSDLNGKFSETHQINGKTTYENELQQWQGVTLPDTDDKDFVVWMRTAVVDTFTKLHRIINEKSFKKGDILSITIRNYFDVSVFHGTKSIVITTNSSLGGKNSVLGIGFMALGSISLLTAVCFRLLIPPKRSYISLS